jgi:pyruvate dehydrogenase E1 component alpha subunit
LAENPLLPHRKLRELYQRMLHCRALERRNRIPAREALLAATTMHLLPGDILCAEPGDDTLAELAPSNRAGLLKAGLVAPPALPFASKLATAASMARGQLAASPADSPALTLAFAKAGAAEPGWQHALGVAHQVLLPLILVVADATGGRPARAAGALSWANLQRIARRVHLPVLAVDGEDAVAVYRCMQEAVIRARGGGGTAILWAVLTPAIQHPLRRSQQPLMRLREYMAARKIPIPR